MSAQKRQQDQIAAIKARVGGLPSSASSAAPPPSAAPGTDTAPAADRKEQALGHFIGRVEHLVANRAVERIPIGHIAPDLRPEMRQPRMLPLPEELVVGGVVPTMYQELVAELRTLGASMAERQLQPIVVYPGSSDRYPAARYLILIGQRRWTAAHLVGMQVIDAVAVDPPSPLDRLQLQYRENEDREDFSDMERAWALHQLRQAMGGDSVPITEVTGLLNIKRSRAYQLLRMLAFTPDQQRTVALLRLQERQILSLTDAIHQGHLTATQVDHLLQRLAEIAAGRALDSATLANAETTQSSESPRRVGIEAQTVARLVVRELAHTTPVAQTPVPRWYPPLQESIASAVRSLRRALDRADALGPNEIHELREELLNLQSQVQRLLARVDQGRESDSNRDERGP
jgi:ParB/RepB/Spo0J family partition protein